MTIKITPMEIEMLDHLNHARDLANRLYAHDRHQSTYGKVSAALDEGLRVSFLGYHADTPIERERANRFAETFHQHLLDGESVTTVMEYLREVFVSDIRRMLTEDALPLSDEEFADHHELRDDGSLLVRLHGEQTQHQAYALIMAEQGGTYPEYVVEKFLDDRIIVRPAYGLPS